MHIISSCFRRLFPQAAQILGKSRDIKSSIRELKNILFPVMKCNALLKENRDE
jgi:hypothetical protein